MPYPMLGSNTKVPRAGARGSSGTHKECEKSLEVSFPISSILRDLITSTMFHTVRVKMFGMNWVIVWVLLIGHGVILSISERCSISLSILSQ